MLIEGLEANKNIVKQLATEGLLSVEQFEQLSMVKRKLTPEIFAVSVADGPSGDRLVRLKPDI